MRIKQFAAVAGVLMLSAMAAAQNVTYDYDKAADFSSFKTYGWTRGVNLDDELNHNRIVNAIDAQLAARQLRKLEPTANPDVLVAYHASFDRDLQITGFGSGWGGYRFGGSGTGTARTEEILTGTLAVDIVNARTNVIVWRGIATKEIDVNAKPETRERNINRAAEKLFKFYPPAASGRH